jgi:nucleoside diphosphate kinase
MGIRTIKKFYSPLIVFIEIGPAIAAIWSGKSAQNIVQLHFSSGFF